MCFAHGTVYVMNEAGKTVQTYRLASTQFPPTGGVTVRDAKGTTVLDVPQGTFINYEPVKPQH